MSSSASDPVGSPAPLAATDAAAGVLLQVEDLSISFHTSSGELPVTRKVGFSIGRGERVGLVGESGCGKTVTGLSLLRLLPADSVTIAGSILFEGKDLASLRERKMRMVRGRDIAMIFQEPMSALDPVFTIGHQISEAWRAHYPGSRAQARERAVDMLSQVGIPLPDRRYDEYPHQLSGGMRQRVMIAMALICEPKLLVADEPTTALDVTVQAQITTLLRELSERTGTAMLFITHDLGVVAETCTRMLTMYAGEIVEDASVDEALVRPRHPYTSGLLRSLPGLSERRAALPSIPGHVPAPGQMPPGCRFAPRCGHSRDICHLEQRMEIIDTSGRRVRCVRARELNLPGAVSDQRGEPVSDEPVRGEPMRDEPVSATGR